MSEEYVLTRDIIYDHSERMLNIKKYYPFFKLCEMSFRQYKDGRYEILDMGYILMAVLRFFIEKNNFNEELVTYEEYASFMKNILRRDFDVEIAAEEENELVSFIFDKIKNDGKPFTFTYYNPVDKKRQSVRVRILDSKISEGIVYYSITADAVEFYLDTKEIKDESNITIDQVLLGKLISSKNFKGGTEVVRRINNEVGRLIARKNEVLGILSYDVFQGAKAYEEFTKTGIKWFEEEQKLFAKNKELIEQALKQGESENKYYSALDDIYQLEAELNRAITRHSRLLSECTDLQVKADEIISKAKFGRLRTAFDFRDYLKKMMEYDRADLLQYIMLPMMGLNINKQFAINNIDNMLTYRPDNPEKGEKIAEETEAKYVYPDEIEDERIRDNYGSFLRNLFDMFGSSEVFTLREWMEKLSDLYGEEIVKNGDLYSFLVHLCQKKEYHIGNVVAKPDTFLEEIIKYHFENEEKYEDLSFNIDGAEDVIETDGIARMADLKFTLMR